MKDANDIRRMKALIEEMIPESERRQMGWNKGKNDGLIEKRIMDLYERMEHDITKSQMFSPQVKLNDKMTIFKWQAKSADGEIAFNFEDPDDAQVLYNFIIENSYLEPGEVTIYMDEHQNSVHLASHVLYSKPDIFKAILDVYNDFVIDDSENVEAYESIGEEIDRILTERTKISGAPKGRAKGNPFHDDSGKFSGPDQLSRDGMGSFSAGKTRLKYSKSSKSKKGDVVVHFAATKKPCGRNARKQGKDIRCMDGKPGIGSSSYGENVNNTEDRLFEIINKYKKIV